jgi:hypothetical protein
VSARADWHTLDLEALVREEGEFDPFSAPVEELGERIELDNPKDRLQLRLSQLLEREGALWNRGVTCPIKDMPDTSCSACPVSRHTDFDDRLGMLCRVGRDEEKVCTELAAIQCQRV